MHMDAHYYAVLAFARACGYTKDAAWTLAYASQFVDDALINQLSIAQETYGIPLDHHSPPSLLNMATCHAYARIKTFNLSAMINNTCAFHFVPGCEGESFTWRMVCRPKGRILEGIAKDVLAQDNLVKFGVFLHAWADSYSHEGFSGLLSKANDIEHLESLSKVYFSTKTVLPKVILYLRRKGVLSRFDTVVDYIVPAYGHAQALHYPDEPYLKWHYYYDNKDIIYQNHFTGQVIDNKERYRKAFDSVELLLDQFISNNPIYKDKFIPKNMSLFSELYDTLFLGGTSKTRIELWKDTIKRLKLLDEEDIDILNYRKDAWFDEAFSNYKENPRKFRGRIVENAILRETFPESRWYQFCQAVRWYKERFHSYADQEGLPFDHEPYLKN